MTLEYVDKSALKSCRFNDKLCKKIKDLDKLQIYIQVSYQKL